MIRIISVISSLLFLSFTVVQINDPDPVFWITFYSAVTIICFLGVLNKQNKKIVLAGMIASILVAAYYAPGFIEWLGQPDKSEIFGEMVYKKSYIEETREFLGSLIGLAALIYQYLKV